MTDFKFRSKPQEFKLGVNNMGIQPLPRDLTPFYSQTVPNKPIILPMKPQPNIFFTPIDDNRELVLERVKRELDYQLKLTKNILPERN